jgi:hypothetical protein
VLVPPLVEAGHRPLQEQGQACHLAGAGPVGEASDHRVGAGVGADVG